MNKFDQTIVLSEFCRNLQNQFSSNLNFSIKPKKNHLIESYIQRAFCFEIKFKALNFTETNKTRPLHKTPLLAALFRFK
ncbi:hypothetical protein LEP1GSC172_3624 [Leptospira noguchii]|uniref:Uncharacterized protein n=2 Tax=Leptospira noguchii TaxID=28182 RepID=T0GVV9_9LEPT|nr:hypothetical protein LEP1GSC172_3624 [Leptospira noguchii]EQA71476.1 hypothetical protein LEP1GSC059_2676 [Leptospira noguchii serovar Panama str. CZ214]